MCFLFMCAPTHKLTCLGCVTYGFVCFSCGRTSSKLPDWEGWMAGLVLCVCVCVWLQFALTIDWPVNNRLVRPNNQCDGATVSPLTDKLLSQWAVRRLFRPQNQKITRRLSARFRPSSTRLLRECTEAVWRRLDPETRRPHEMTLWWFVPSSFLFATFLGFHWI